nr:MULTISPECIES: hypothetical protein [unclassified Streptomyces]
MPALRPPHGPAPPPHRPPGALLRPLPPDQGGEPVTSARREPGWRALRRSPGLALDLGSARTRVWTRAHTILDAPTVSFGPADDAGVVRPVERGAIVDSDGAARLLTRLLAPPRSPVRPPRDRLHHPGARRRGTPGGARRGAGRTAAAQRAGDRHRPRDRARGRCRPVPAAARRRPRCPAHRDRPAVRRHRLRRPPRRTRHRRSADPDREAAGRQGHRGGHRPGAGGSTPGVRRRARPGAAARRGRRAAPGAGPPARPAARHLRPAGAPAAHRRRTRGCRRAGLGAAPSRPGHAGRPGGPRLTAAGRPPRPPVRCRTKEATCPTSFRVPSRRRPSPPTAGGAGAPARCAGPGTCCWPGPDCCWARWSPRPRR